MIPDEKDIEILRLVQDDGRMPQAEIGRRVGLSAAAVCERLKKLEHRRIITGYSARVDPARVHCGITAFVEVLIEDQRHEADFIARVLEIPEIQECHHVTGEFSCLLKIKTRDRLSFKHVLLEQINSLAGVRQTRTLISLDTPKEDFRIPLDIARPAGTSTDG